MNEFIVWDNQKKEFVKGLNNEFFAIENDGTKIIDNYGFEELITNRYEFFNYVGLKDTDNKKIYADSSIIEFNLKDELIYVDFTGKEPTVWNIIKMKGHFTFNDEYLRYEIDILDWEKDKTKSRFICLYYNPEIMNNFKIIDTIQENKLKLIEVD